MGGSRSSDDDSSSEDGDAEWRASISSIATTTFIPSINPTTTTTNETKSDNKTTKLYHIKAQKLLDDILEKSLQVVTREPTEVVEDDSIANGGGGVRLFRDAPIGIVFDRANEYQGPLKRPRIIPKEEVDEKSKKFRQQIKSAAVDGNDIIASAKQAREKFLAKLAAREAAAKLKAQKEEERVAELKKIRGERWLPAIARQMRLK
ncbi:hypothetical protein Tco_0233827 [Tanacetum coccineum]